MRFVEGSGLTWRWGRLGGGGDQARSPRSRTPSPYSHKQHDMKGGCRVRDSKSIPGLRRESMSDRWGGKVKASLRSLAVIPDLAAGKAGVPRGVEGLGVGCRIVSVGLIKGPDGLPPPHETTGTWMNRIFLLFITPVSGFFLFKRMCSNASGKQHYYAKPWGMYD